MSTELAVTAVTESLRDLLTKGVLNKWGADVLSGDIQKQLYVEALPPHKVRDHHATENVLNVFLYRTEVNAAWRNQALPAAGKSAETAMPPLALNLEYLITAYGEDDREEVAHFFLAQAMRVLHDTAFVPRQKFFDVLKKARIQDQVERITVSPKVMSVDEISKLWSALQSHYRLSAAYLITVVLIDSQVPARSALPVLKRGKDDSGIQALASVPPLLASATPATGFGAARLDEDLTVTGDRLDTAGLSALLRHPFMPAPIELPITPVSPTQVTVRLPKATAGSGVSLAWPAGIYSLSLKVTRPSLPSSTTNEVPFLLAPSITVSPSTKQPPGAFELTIVATPQFHSSQTAVILFDDVQVTPKSIVTPPADPDAATTFKADITAAMAPVGFHRVRLRVDGIDSIPIKVTAGGFDFDDAQSVEVKP